MTDGIAAFIKARLDERKELALAASPGPWTPDAEGDEVLADDGITVCDGFALSGWQLRATVAHIAAHDPARVLREVAAWRAVVELCEYMLGWNAQHSRETTDHEIRAMRTAGGEQLRRLAAIWDDHPKYKAEWAV